MIDPAYLEKLGVFVDADGSYKRYRVRIENAEYDPTDPKAELKGLLLSYDEVRVPYPVVLPLATDPDSIEDARKRAVKLAADFYHPKHGWLRWGRKRETEAPENLGAGSVRYASQRVVVGRTEPERERPEHPREDPREPEPLPDAEPEPETEPWVPATERPAQPEPVPSAKGRR